MPTKRSQDTRSRTNLIRASELEQYEYCARAWWLSRVEGVWPSNLHQLETGTAVHVRHGAGVALANLLARLALVCLVLGGLLALVWLVLTMAH